MPKGKPTSGKRVAKEYPVECACGCGLPAKHGRRLHDGHKDAWEAAWRSNPPKCPCGCEKDVPPGKTFATSGCACRGRKNPHSPEHRRRISESRRGWVPSEETRRLWSEQRRGDRNPAKRADVRLKISLNRKGKRAGKDHPFFGKLRPEHSEKIRGPNHPNWKGGLGKKYPPEFSEALKKKIKRRDDFRCKMCGTTSVTGHRLEIHHKDRNRKNNQEKNLVTLCQPCHLSLHGAGRG